MKTLMMIEPCQLTRTAIKQVLAGKVGTEIELVGETAGGREGLKLTLEYRPDVVLLEMGLPNISGLNILQRLKYLLPKTRVLFFSTQRHVIFPIRAFKIGAVGYLTKDERVEVVVHAILTASAKQPVCSPALLHEMALAKLDRQHICHLLATLSINEIHLLRGLAQGKHPVQVARELNISRKTIFCYRHHLLKKLQLSTNPALANFAKEHQLID